MKTCTKCGETKPLDEFHRMKKSKDGRNPWCRTCKNARERDHRSTDPAYRERNRQLCKARYHGERLEPVRLARPIEERFNEKWSEDEDGCWIWTATLAESGYGQFGVEEQVLYAHRVSYTFAYGPIPDGLELHHKCGKPACVRPECLIALTQEAHRELHVKRPA